MSTHDHGNCSEVLSILYEYVDGELTIERRTTIQTHLDDCPPCLEAFGFEEELRVVISQRCRDEVPQVLRDRIRQALDSEI